MKNIALFYFGDMPVLGKISECQQLLLQPFSIDLQPTGDGRAHIKLTPFGALFGALKPVPELFLDRAIAGPIEPPPEMVQGYVQMTSGIAIAAPSLIQTT